MMLDGGTVSVLPASCDSTEGWEKYKRRGVVASLEILLHTIYYPHNTPQPSVQQQQQLLPTAIRVYL